VVSSGKAGISRRDLIKRSAIVGGVAWVAPVILAKPAAAATTYLGCTNCPTGQLYFLRWTSAGVCANSTIVNSCLNNNQGSPPPSQTYPTGCGGSDNDCCLITAGLVAVSGTSPTHTWVLDPGVNFCGAHAFGGNSCTGVTVLVTPNSPSAGFTTVTVTKSNMSHSDIAVCVPGTTVGGCAGCGA
jgi:hypothetical protein